MPGRQTKQISNAQLVKTLLRKMRKEVTSMAADKKLGLCDISTLIQIVDHFANEHLRSYSGITLNILERLLETNDTQKNVIQNLERMCLDMIRTETVRDLKVRKSRKRKPKYPPISGFLAHPCVKDKYTLVKSLGAGFYGEVSLVTHNKKQYAMKKISLSHMSFKEQEILLSKVEEEVRIMQSLRRVSYVPKYYEHFVCPDKDHSSMAIYIVMEYIQGTTLGEYRHQYPVTPALKTSLRKVFQKLHQRGIRHNDIKGDNIMVTKQGKVYIIDFGLADSCERLTESAVDTLLSTLEPTRSRVSLCLHLLLHVGAIC